MLVELTDGARTTLAQWGPAGPVIVCVHGITGSRMGWERFARAFSGRYRVFAYDQRGHGDSSQIHGPMTLGQSIADLRSVNAAIGEDPVAIVGHSWGGAVVLMAGPVVACESVIAIDPMIRQRAGTWREKFVDGLSELLAGSPAEREARIREAYADSAPIDLEGKVHALRTMSIDPIVALGRENGADEGRWDLRSLLVDYPKPLLLMLADPAKSIVAPEDVEDVRKTCGPNVRISTYLGEGHGLHRTAFDRFAEEVRAFLPR